MGDPGTLGTRRRRGRARRRVRSGAVCGLAGILQLDGAPGLARRALAYDRGRGAPRARRGGLLRRRAVGFGHRRLAIQDPTPAGQQPMATPDGRYVLSYNGEVYNFRELRVELRGARARFHSRSDTEVVLARASPSGATTRSCASTACSRFASGTRERRELLLARDRYGIKPLYYRPASGTRSCSARRSRRCWPTRRCGARWTSEALREYLTFQNSSPIARCSRASGCCRRRSFVRLGVGTRARGPTALLGLRVRGGRRRRRRGIPRGAGPAASRRPSSRQLVSDVPVGHLPLRRHGLGLDHGDRRPQLPDLQDLHGRLRPALGVGARAGLRRARARRAPVVPVRHRALPDGPQGRRHGARPAAPGLAPRGACASASAIRTSTPPSSRAEVRQGRAVRAPAATSSSAATRGATTAPWSTTTSSTTSTSTTTTGSAWSPSRRCAACSRRSGPRSGDVSTRDIFRDVFPAQRRARRRAPRTTSTTRSTWRRGRSCTGCWSSRTSSRWRTAWRRACPSSTTTSSTSPSACRSASSSATCSEVVRINENEPGAEGRAVLRAGRRRQAAPAPGDGPPRARGGRDERQAGLLGARRDLVPRREHRLRATRPAATATRASTSGSTATSCGRWSTSTSAAARTAGC